MELEGELSESVAEKEDPRTMDESENRQNPIHRDKESEILNDKISDETNSTSLSIEDSIKGGIHSSEAIESEIITKDSCEHPDQVSKKNMQGKEKQQDETTPKQENPTSVNLIESIPNPIHDGEKESEISNDKISEETNSTPLNIEDSIEGDTHSNEGMESEIVTRDSLEHSDQGSKESVKGDEKQQEETLPKQENPRSVIVSECIPNPIHGDVKESQIPNKISNKTNSTSDTHLKEATESEITIEDSCESFDQGSKESVQGEEKQQKKISQQENPTLVNLIESTPNPIHDDDKESEISNDKISNETNSISLSIEDTIEGDTHSNETIESEIITKDSSDPSDQGSKQSKQGEEKKQEETSSVQENPRSDIVSESISNPVHDDDKESQIPKDKISYEIFTLDTHSNEDTESEIITKDSCETFAQGFKESMQGEEKQQIKTSPEQENTTSVNLIKSTLNLIHDDDKESKISNNKILDKTKSTSLNEDTLSNEGMESEIVTKDSFEHSDQGSKESMQRHEKQQEETSSKQENPRSVNVSESTPNPTHDDGKESQIPKENFLDETNSTLLSIIDSIKRDNHSNNSSKSNHSNESTKSEIVTKDSCQPSHQDSKESRQGEEKQREKASQEQENTTSINLIESIPNPILDDDKESKISNKKILNQTNSTSLSIEDSIEGDTYSNEATESDIIAKDSSNQGSKESMQGEEKQEEEILSKKESPSSVNVNENITNPIYDDDKESKIPKDKTSYETNSNALRIGDSIEGEIHANGATESEIITKDSRENFDQGSKENTQGEQKQQEKTCENFDQGSKENTQEEQKQQEKTSPEQENLKSINVSESTPNPIHDNEEESEIPKEKNLDETNYSSLNIEDSNEGDTHSSEEIQSKNITKDSLEHSNQGSKQSVQGEEKQQEETSPEQEISMSIDVNVSTRNTIHDDVKESEISNGKISDETNSTSLSIEDSIEGDNHSKEATKSEIITKDSCEHHNKGSKGSLQGEEQEQEETSHEQENPRLINVSEKIPNPIHDEKVSALDETNLILSSVEGTVKVENQLSEATQVGVIITKESRGHPDQGIKESNQEDLKQETSVLKATQVGVIITKESREHLDQGIKESNQEDLKQETSVLKKKESRTDEANENTQNTTDDEKESKTANNKASDETSSIFSSVKGSVEGDCQITEMKIDRKDSWEHIDQYFEESIQGEEKQQSETLVLEQGGRRRVGTTENTLNPIDDEKKIEIPDDKTSDNTNWIFSNIKDAVERDNHSRRLDSQEHADSDLEERPQREDKHIVETSAQGQEINAVNQKLEIGRSLIKDKKDSEIAKDDVILQPETPLVNVQDETSDNLNKISDFKTPEEIPEHDEEHFRTPREEVIQGTHVEETNYNDTYIPMGESEGINIQMENDRKKGEKNLESCVDEDTKASENEQNVIEEYKGLEVSGDRENSEKVRMNLNQGIQEPNKEFSNGKNHYRKLETSSYREKVVQAEDQEKEEVKILSADSSREKNNYKTRDRVETELQCATENKNNDIEDQNAKEGVISNNEVNGSNLIAVQNIQEFEKSGRCTEEEIPAIKDEVSKQDIKSLSRQFSTNEKTQEQHPTEFKEGITHAQEFDETRETTAMKEKKTIEVPSNYQEHIGKFVEAAHKENDAKEINSGETSEVSIKEDLGRDEKETQNKKEPMTFLLQEPEGIKHQNIQNATEDLPHARLPSKDDYLHEPNSVKMDELQATNSVNLSKEKSYHDPRNSLIEEQNKDEMNTRKEVKISTKQSMALETNKIQKVSLQQENETEETLHKMEKTDEGEEQKDELDQETPVTVDESGDVEEKINRKKTHSILSGVGSKVKHSIAKVKKVITGKSSQTKSIQINKETQ